MGGATQADRAFLQLCGSSVDIIVNRLPVSQNFLSAPLSHYDVILGNLWLKDNRILMDYAHNALWQCSDSGPALASFSGSGWLFRLKPTQCIL